MLLHAAHREQHGHPVTIVEQREKTLVVIECGRIGVRRLRVVGRSLEVHALLLGVRAQRVVVGEGVDVLVERGRVRGLDVRPDTLVQIATEGERKAVIGDVARRHVPEEVLEVCHLRRTRNQFGADQPAEAAADGGLTAELRRTAPHPLRVKGAPDDACDLQHRVVALASWSIRAITTPYRVSGTAARANAEWILEIDPALQQQGDELFEEERVAFGPLDRVAHRRRKLVELVARGSQLGAGETLGIVGSERLESKLCCVLESPGPAKRSRSAARESTTTRTLIRSTLRPTASSSAFESASIQWQSSRTSRTGPLAA